MNKLFYGDNLDVLREHVADGSVQDKKSDEPYMCLAIVEPEKRSCGTKGKQGHLL